MACCVCGCGCAAAVLLAVWYGMLLYGMLCGCSMVVAAATLVSGGAAASGAAPLQPAHRPPGQLARNRVRHSTATAHGSWVLRSPRWGDAARRLPRRLRAHGAGTHQSSPGARAERTPTGWHAGRHPASRQAAGSPRGRAKHTHLVPARGRWSRRMVDGVACARGAWTQFIRMWQRTTSRL
jgi:hypothetical protein